ncbi:MAG: pyridoxal-phosphate dependent enzyme [Streptosporangiaceae bacterium]
MSRPRPLVHESVLDAIGHTPLIRLTRVTAGLTVPVYVKAEFLGVGASVKDRAARHMVAVAEQDGSLRPGGVIVESTSGNTGIGLAIVSAQRGYQLIVVVPDKTSPDKIAVLRAHGAQVVVTRSGVPRDHPEHVDQMARRIADQTPGGWLACQYDNPANPRAHRDSTGPEIWEQTGGQVTHLVAGAGTGGTITGTGEYLKQVSGGRVQVIGADPATSVYGGGDGSPYYIEAVGHWHHPDSPADTWPQSFHPDVVDRFEQVTDRESISMIHRLAREEGLLLGGSAGLAIAAALRAATTLTAADLVVVIAPDSGRGYLAKYFSEPWLLANGFADAAPGAHAIADLVTDAAPVLVLTPSATVAEARRMFASRGGAVMPDIALVALPRPAMHSPRARGDVVASLRRDALEGQPDGQPISGLTDPPPPVVGAGECPADALARIPAGEPWAAVLVDGQVTALIRRVRLAGELPTKPM